MVNAEVRPLRVAFGQSTSKAPLTLPGDQKQDSNDVITGGCCGFFVADVQKKKQLRLSREGVDLVLLRW